MLALLAIISFSCKGTEPDPTPDPDPVDTELEGLFVFGTNTVATEAGSSASRISAAVLDPGKGAQVDSLAKIFGKFIHIGAGGEIQLDWAENGSLTTYGSPNGGTVDSATNLNSTINDEVIHGDLVADGDPIQVADEGLYYLFVNLENETFILMPVKAQIIGDATELEWSAGTPLALKSSDVNETVFERANVPLVGASGYRYRFNDGWHVYDDGTRIVTLSSLGVESYGEAWDNGVNDIGYFLDNAPNKEPGMYTLTLTYDAASGEWEETKVRTGDLITDYSTVEFGWFGNAYYDSDSTEGAWDTIDLTRTPEQNGNEFSWTWTVELIQDRSFVLRENDPNGAWITYGGANKTGTAFTDDLIIKETGQDNYYVVQAGEYDVTFTIDASTDGRTLNIEPK